MVQSNKKFVVMGYALTSKKVKSFLQPKLESLARTKGILFVAIDQSKPLSDQGPFDIVLHKLAGSKWRRILEEYRLTHPEVTVLDPPDAIQHVYNRKYMLEDVADLNLSDSYGKVGVPRQLVIEKDSSSIPDAVSKAGLRLPLVAKPLAAKSHELSLAYDKFSLQMLEPPHWCYRNLLTMEEFCLRYTLSGKQLRLLDDSVYLMLASVSCHKTLGFSDSREFLVLLHLQMKQI